MFWNIFKRKPKKFLGIDIGAYSIRVVEIEREEKGYRLSNYGEVNKDSFSEQPFRIFQKNSLSLSNKDIAEAIKTICEEAEIQTKDANLSIPDFCSFFTSFSLPKMEKNEVQEAIRFQVRPYVPLPLDEIALDWSIIEGEPGKTGFKVLVVAIPKEYVTQYQEIAKLSGLKLKFLESEVFALTRSLVGEGGDKRVVSIIDIGARSTTCSILENNVLKTSYSFNLAGNNLTEVLARSLDIDYNKAEEIKKKFGIAENIQQQESQFGEKNVREILLPLVDSIIEEIKKIFREFYRKEGKQVEKIILSGGVSAMLGIKEYFSESFKKEVALADPFFHLLTPPVLSETLKRMRPFYGVAVGLALKGFE